MRQEPDFTVPALGERRIPSPLRFPEGSAGFASDSEFVRHDVIATPGAQAPLERSALLEKAGPRSMICLSPSHVHAEARSSMDGVVVVAEGDGLELLVTEGADASGNRKLGDIGLLLRDRIHAHFAARGVELDLKCVDPSYIVRPARANHVDPAGAPWRHALEATRQPMIMRNGNAS